MTQAVEVLPSLAINPTITMCPDSLHRDLLHVALTHPQVNTIMSHIQLQQSALTIFQVSNHLTINVSYPVAGEGSHHFPGEQ